MKPWYVVQESFQSVFKTISVNRLRTILSLLGITIGIFAIISVFTIIDSLEQNVRKDMSTLGDDVIYVQKWPWAPEEGNEYEWWEYLNRPVPTQREYLELKKRIKKAEAVCFFAATSKTVKYNDNSADGYGIWGITEEFEKIRSFTITQGRFFNSYDIESGKNLAVIGDKVKSDLFGNDNPIGKKIKVSDKNLIVIGTFEKEGNSVFGGGSVDETVMVPINFLAKIIDLKDEQSNSMIWVKTAGGVPIMELKDELRGTMRAIRRLKPKAEDNFALNQTSLINAGISQIFSVINLAGWVIGLLSVLVGGFGIANIMFVSVKERTNTIGIQKALGAKNKYILFEVLNESGLLSLLGGTIGLVLIFLGTLIVNSTTDFVIYLTLKNIILGMLISFIVGMVSGIAPALTAARLNPVEAISSTF